MPLALAGLVVVMPAGPTGRPVMAATDDAGPVSMGSGQSHRACWSVQWTRVVRRLCGMEQPVTLAVVLPCRHILPQVRPAGAVPFRPQTLGRGFLVGLDRLNLPPPQVLAH